MPGPDQSKAAGGKSPLEGQQTRSISSYSAHLGRVENTEQTEKDLSVLPFYLEADYNLCIITIIF